MGKRSILISKRGNQGTMVRGFGGAGNLAWARRIDGAALFAFAMGACFLYGYGQERALGIIMISSVLMANANRLGSFLRQLKPVPPELKFYSAWVVWAGLTGLAISADLDRFWTGYRVLLQVFVMVWIVYAILRRLGNVDVVFLALLAGALIQVGVVGVGINAGAGVGDLLNPSQRIVGGTQNPNSLGFLMVWAVLCALMFWHGSRRWVLQRKLVVLGVIAVAVVVLLASGSRKSTIALGLLLFAWIVFVRGTARGVKKLASSIVVGSVVLFATVNFGPSVMQETIVGQRFGQLFQGTGGNIGQVARSNIRYWMYVEGLKIFAEHPLFGVGLNNFGVYFYTGQYSHSDYMEPLATTGLVGFVLYESFYVLLILRCLRLLGVVRAAQLRYRLKMVLLGLLAIMVIGLGAPHYTDVPVFLLLTAFSVLTHGLQQHVLALRRSSSGWPRSRRMGRPDRAVLPQLELDSNRLYYGEPIGGV